MVDSDVALDSTYRKDIQGLRGVAVLAVVAYHIGLPIHGGFIGVDIFFTISGYVISQAIANDVNSSDGFRLRTFFARRINRLIPLLSVVNIAIMLIALVSFSPFTGSIEQVTSAVRSSIGFYSNAHFFLSNNYLDLVANPARHLWSLSVEEQFYFVLPLLVVASLIFEKRFGQSRDRSLTLFLLIIGILSLFTCIYLTRTNSSQMQSRLAFFGTPFRAWEFIAGVLVQKISIRKFATRPVRIASNTFGLFSFLVLTLCIYNTALTYHFPNAWTILPIACTACLLLLGVRSKVTHQILSFPPLVWLGDRSYGWYLWHWPLIVFATSVFTPSMLSKFFAALIALVISAFTYGAVEQRFRRHKASPTAFKLLAVCIFAVLGSSILVNSAAKTGLGIPTDNGWTSGIHVDDADLGTNKFLLRSLGDCYQHFYNQLSVDNECTNGVINGPLVLVVGDSQVQSAADGLFEAGRQLGVRVMGFGAGGCPMQSRSALKYSSWCPAVQEMYLNAVSQWKPDLVVFANRYDDYVVLGGVEGSEDRVPFADGALPSGRDEQIDSIIQSVSERVSAVEQLHTKVAILIETPNVLYPAQSVITRYFSVLRKVQFADIEDRNLVRSKIIALITHDKSLQNVVFVDPTDTLCPSVNNCSIVLDGELAFWNPQHMNRIGSLKLVSLWKTTLFAELGL